jgi:hypothetical protein
MTDKQPIDGEPPAAAAERAFAPHCDSLVLHAPGKCRFCDMYADWQEERTAHGMNFTGEQDPSKFPDPAETRRPLPVIERWMGNVPKPAGDEQEFRAYPNTWQVDTAVSAGRPLDAARIGGLEYRAYYLPPIPPEARNPNTQTSLSRGVGLWVRWLTTKIGGLRW